MPYSHIWTLIFIAKSAWPPDGLNKHRAPTRLLSTYKSRQQTRMNSNRLECRSPDSGAWRCNVGTDSTREPWVFKQNSPPFFFFFLDQRPSVFLRTCQGVNSSPWLLFWAMLSLHQLCLRALWVAGSFMMDHFGENGLLALTVCRLEYQEMDRI